jgi:hypothetical protein
MGISVWRNSGQTPLKAASRQIPFQKGRQAVNATCSDTSETIMAASRTDHRAEHLDSTNNFLYKAATVLAILLFLVSF